MRLLLISTEDQRSAGLLVFGYLSSPNARSATMLSGRRYFTRDLFPAVRGRPGKAKGSRAGVGNAKARDGHGEREGPRRAWGKRKARSLKPQRGKQPGLSATRASVRED